MPTPYPRDLVGYGPNPPARRLAGRCPDRGPVRPQLRGGRRELRPARRRRVRGVPVRDRRRRSRSGRAPHEHGVRSTSTAPAPASGACCGCSTAARRAADRLRRGHGAGAPPRGRRGRWSRPATRSRATAGAGSTIRTCPRTIEREHIRRRSRSCTAGHRRARRSAGTPAAPAPTRRRLVAEQAASSTTPTTTPTTCPTGSQVERQAAADRALHAGRQRHALRHAAGLQLGRPVLQPTCKDSFDVLYAEGAETPEDDVGRPALPPGRPARPDRGAGALPRLCRRATSGLVLPPRRDRAALARAAPLPAIRMIARALGPARW